MPHIVFLSHIDMNLYLFRRPIMRVLVERGWQVTAVVPEGEFSGRFAADGIAHVAYPIDRGGMNPLRELQVVLRLRRVLKALHPDLVHTFTMKPNIYGTFAARLAGVPLVVNSVTGLGSFFLEGEARGPVPRMLLGLYRLAGRLTSRMVFQNRDDRQFFLDHELVAETKTAMIKGSGVDLARFDPARIDSATTESLRDHLGIAPKLPVVTCIARLLRDKGVGEFCEAARRLHGQWQGKAVFLLVGDFYAGNPSALPRDYIEALAGDGIIHFAGWRNDIPEILAMSDIVVLPSYREGLPVSLQEALAMAKPVVTTDVPGCRETVDHGVNGLLVPARDAGAVAAAVEKLLLDPESCGRMGAASLEKARAEFDVRRIVDRHVALYEEVLASSDKGTAV